MISRTDTNRKRTPLHPACLLYHELERVTAAWEQARALALYPLADTLLVERNTLIARIARRDEQAEVR